MGASPTPSTLEWDQDDPGEAATGCSVLRTEARWYPLNLGFAGSGDAQVSGRTHLLPLQLLSPPHPLALLDVKEIPALGRQPGSHTGLV